MNQQERDELRAKHIPCIEPGNEHWCQECQMSYPCDTVETLNDADAKAKIIDSLAELLTVEQVLKLFRQHGEAMK